MVAVTSGSKQLSLARARSDQAIGDEGASQTRFDRLMAAASHSEAAKPRGKAKPRGSDSCSTGPEVDLPDLQGGDAAGGASRSFCAAALVKQQSGDPFPTDRFGDSVCQLRGYACQINKGGSGIDHKVKQMFA